LVGLNHSSFCVRATIPDWTHTAVTVPVVDAET